MYYLSYQYFKKEALLSYGGIYDTTLVIYSLSLFAVVLSGFMATISDPTDSHIKRKLKG